MSGMAEILDENTRLRAQLQERDAIIEALQETVRLYRLQEAHLEKLNVIVDRQNEVLEQQAELLREQAVQLAQLDEVKQHVLALAAENDRLTKHLAFLEQKRRLAKAERFIADENQIALFADSEVVVPPRDTAIQADDENRPSGDKRKTSKHPRKGRRDVTKLGFPKQVVHAPLNPSSCEDCGGNREAIEPQVSHRVGWRPGHFVLLEVQQHRCACPTCPEAKAWTAPEPFLLPGSMCDDALLAQILVDKFGDHIPLNRQAARMKRAGFPIGTNVLSGWANRAYLEVRPLVKAVMMQVANSSLIQSDDTGYGVQDGNDGKLANGRLWVFTDQRQAFFGFSRTKEGDHPAGLLQSLGVEDCRFIADGGSEFNEAERRLALDRGGCWSHLRRYFHEAALQHEEARIGLMAIRDVFLIERDLVDLAPPARVLKRMERSQPVVDGFFDWVRGMSQTARPKSKLGKALGYALSQEPRMRLFLRSGDVPIHNNLSELLLRQPVIGRKNWMFSRSEGGAVAAAGWFTLIGSCLLQGLDPLAYLYDVFRRLPDHPSKWVHELTPLNWRLAVEAGDLKPLSPGQFA